MAKKSAKKSLKKSLKKSAKETAKKSSPKKANKSQNQGRPSVKAKAASKPAPKKVAAQGKKPAVKAAPTKKPAVKAAAKPAAKNTASAKPTDAAKMHLVKSNKAQSIDLSQVFAPLDDRVVITTEESATRTPGGLFIPDTVAKEERHLQGRVIAVGRGHFDKKGRLQPLDVQIGDLVLYTPYSGSELKVNNMELVILREADILGVIAP